MSGIHTRPSSGATAFCLAISACQLTLFMNSFRSKSEPVKVLANQLQQLHAVKVLLGAGKKVLQRLEVLHQAATGLSPVSGALVAAAILAVAIQEVVRRVEGLIEDGVEERQVVQRHQRRLENVSIDPDVPVVDGVGAQHALPPVVRLQVALKDALPKFVVDAAVDHRRDVVKLLRHQQLHPTDKFGNLAGAQVDGQVARGGQVVAGALQPREMSRPAPGTFLHQTPHAVDDLVDVLVARMVSSVVQQIAHHQGVDASLVGGDLALVVGPVSVSGVLQIADGRLHRVLLTGEGHLGGFHQLGANIGGQIFH
ncbi:hypothetical protein TYRP_009972 [Tyrophagus putrescentiae]|nr:hypothetical protein TYRP_009972 [Tyrophagus putrescentiae]